MRTSITILLVFQALLIIPAFGQNFAFHSNSPFGIQIMHEDSSRVANKVMFFDFDGDDDLDLFLSGIDNFGDFESWESVVYFIEMQENIGDKWNPQFAARVEPFANFPFPTGYFFPAIGDVNNDGDPDFVVFGDVNFFGGRTMLYLESDGRSSAGFNVVKGDFYGLTDFVPESFFIPEIVDLDSDGDQDILMSGFDPAFAEEEGADIPTYYYARNNDIRSPSSAVDFGGWYWNPYGLTPSPLAEILTSGDIDNDGDVDLLGSPLIIPEDSINRIYVHVNTPGITGKPIFDVTLESPFGLPTSFGEEQLLFPDLVDLNSDGDLDLFVFKVTAQGNVLEYYVNTMCEVTTTEMSETICDNESIFIEGIEYTEAGGYTIVTEDPDGCTTILELTLLVEPIYTVNLEESICEGEVFSVGPEDFTEAGHYEILLSTEAGCDSIVILDLTVFHVDNTITQADHILTANQGGAFYQWFDCDTGLDIPGATNQSYEVLVTGTYAVDVTDGSCTETSECLFVMVTTGLNDQLYASGIKVYPNPADEWIMVVNSTQFQVSSLTLLNVSGQEMKEIALNESHRIDIAPLEQGIYFLRLYVNEQVVIRKIVVI